MKNNRQETEGPKDVATSKGPNAKAVGAIASVADYNIVTGHGKEKQNGATEPKAAHSARARYRCREARSGKRAAGLPQAAYCDSAGRKWAYRGKRARVLTMLATTPAGLTQWDTLPWHTRLGGTIHAMRCDGLVIDTEREGEYRHARYRLRTPGTLETGEAQ